MYNLNKMFKFHNYKFKPRNLYKYLSENSYKSSEDLFFLNPTKIFIQFYEENRGLETYFIDVYKDNKYNYIINDNKVYHSKSFENLISMISSKYITNSNFENPNYYAGIYYNKNNNKSKEEFINECYRNNKRIYIKHKLR